MARLNLRDGSSVTIECLGWDRDELGARKRFKWAISAPGDPCIGEGSDLRGPVDADVTSEEMLTSWLGFAGATAEARQFGGTGSENWDLFPERCSDWIFRHSTELQAAELERDGGGHDW